MKLLTLIYSIIIIVSSSSHDRTRKTPQVARGSDSVSQVRMMDDQWPFEDTLRHSDPYVSELITEEDLDWSLPFIRQE